MGREGFVYDSSLSIFGWLGVTMVLMMYLLLGAAAGVLAGLFGIGGGLIIVPVLVFSFQAQGMPTEVLTHMAVVTSLATIVFTSISSIRTHHAKGAVLWKLVWPMSAGIVLGAMFGSHTAALMSGEMLQMVIGLFALCMAAQMGFGLKPSASRNTPPPPGLAFVGAGIGWASAIFGIGGGSLSVPFLTWCNVKMQQAVATSAACGFPIAIAGALMGVYEGWENAYLPEWSVGFVYLPALLGIVMTSVIFARLGAKLAHRLPSERLKKIFALLLLAVGAKFLFL